MYVCVGVPVSVSCQHWHHLLYGGMLILETLVRRDANFRLRNKVEVMTIHPV
jgi:hypothetical protein